jgi:hypothetical protein
MSKKVPVATLLEKEFWQQIVEVQKVQVTVLRPKSVDVKLLNIESMQMFGLVSSLLEKQSRLQQLLEECRVEPKMRCNFSPKDVSICDNGTNKQFN